MKVKFICSDLTKTSANLPTSMDDQCALGPDRQLLDESKIAWHHDPDDLTPIVPVTSPIHQFFAGGSSPALIFNGSRRSG